MTTNVHLLCEHLTNNDSLGDTVPNATQEGVLKILKQELHESCMSIYEFFNAFIWQRIM